MEDFFDHVQENILVYIIIIGVIVCSALFIRCTPEKRNPEDGKIECAYCHGTGKAIVMYNELPGLFKVLGALESLNLSIVKGDCEKCNGAGYIKSPFNFKVISGETDMVRDQPSEDFYEDTEGLYSNPMNNNYNEYNNHNGFDNYNEYNNYEYENSYTPSETWYPCSRCNGTGACRKCGGAGRIYDWGPYSMSYDGKYEQRCPICNGTGNCGVCEGTKGSYH